MDEIWKRLARLISRNCCSSTVINQHAGVGVWFGDEGEQIDQNVVTFSSIKISFSLPQEKRMAHAKWLSLFFFCRKSINKLWAQLKTTRPTIPQHRRMSGECISMDKGLMYGVLQWCAISRVCFNTCSRHLIFSTAGCVSFFWESDSVAFPSSWEKFQPS